MATATIDNPIASKQDGQFVLQVLLQSILDRATNGSVDDDGESLDEETQGDLDDLAELADDPKRLKQLLSESLKEMAEQGRKRLSLIRMAQDGGGSGGWLPHVGTRGNRAGKQGWKRTVGKTTQYYWGEHAPGDGKADTSKSGSAPASGGEKKLTTKEKRLQAKAEKPVKPTVDQVHAHIQGLLSGKEPITADHVADAANRLASLTVKQLGELKAKLGVKASGAKGMLAKKIAEKALAGKASESKESSKTPLTGGSDQTKNAGEPTPVSSPESTVSKTRAKPTSKPASKPTQPKIANPHAATAKPGTAPPKSAAAMFRRTERPATAKATRVDPTQRKPAAKPVASEPTDATKPKLTADEVVRRLQKDGAIDVGLLHQEFAHQSAEEINKLVLQASRTDPKYRGSPINDNRTHSDWEHDRLTAGGDEYSTPIAYVRDTSRPNSESVFRSGSAKPAAKPVASEPTVVETKPAASKPVTAPKPKVEEEAKMQSGVQLPVSESVAKSHPMPGFETPEQIEEARRIVAGARMSESDKRKALDQYLKKKRDINEQINARHAMLGDVNEKLRTRNNRRDSNLFTKLQGDAFNPYHREQNQYTTEIEQLRKLLGKEQAFARAVTESLIRAGKPVPPEVLADYPDLAKKSITPAAKPGTPAAKPVDPIKARADVLSHVQRLSGQHDNYIPLADLKKAVPDMPMQAFHNAVQKLRHEGVLTASAAEGRHGISDEAKATGIPEEDSLLTHVGLKR